jgi:hypothetical protein
MQASKLKPLHVYIIGMVVAFILGLGLFFLLIRPVQGDISTQEQTLSGLQQYSPNSVKQAEADKKKAEEEADLHRAQWLAWNRRQSPPEKYAIPIGPYEQKIKTLDRWWNLPQYIVNEAAAYARGKPGVQVMTDFKRPERSPDANTIPGEIVVWNLGRMYAFGKFNDVMEWARRWNKFKYTAAVDGLDVRLAGKGTVASTANLTLYIWTKNKPGEGGGAPAGGAPGGAEPGAMPSMPMPGGETGGMMTGGGGGMAPGIPSGAGGRKGGAAIE